jgi:hypothetical protein
MALARRRMPHVDFTEGAKDPYQLIRVIREIRGLPPSGQLTPRLGNLSGSPGDGLETDAADSIVNRFATSCSAATKDFRHQLDELRSPRPRTRWGWLTSLRFAIV